MDGISEFLIREFEQNGSFNILPQLFGLPPTITLPKVSKPYVKISTSGEFDQIMTIFQAAGKKVVYGCKAMTCKFPNTPVLIPINTPYFNIGIAKFMGEHEFLTPEKFYEEINVSYAARRYINIWYQENTGRNKTL